jgi:formylglycine-generating enzyme required for sulfatase activity
MAGLAAAVTIAPSELVAPKIEIVGGLVKITIEPSVAGRIYQLQISDSDAPPVTVSAFYMGQHEVTKALWDDVRTWGAVNGYTNLPTGGGKASNHPCTRSVGLRW